MKKYFLMNKDNIVMTLEAETSEVTGETSFRVTDHEEGRMPIGFQDINIWVDSRKAPKHKKRIQNLLREYGCGNDEGYIMLTHATSINDTFWIKEENEEVEWKDVSLYSNPFNEVISRFAFEGIGLYHFDFPSTSPELTSEGSYPKCFRKETKRGEYDSNIFIYKRGGTIGKGLEPYCECMASEIANIISPKNAVHYNQTVLHGKTASKCNLFTDEQYGYASFARIFGGRKMTVQEAMNYFSEIGSEQEFREMLVIDSLCFNQDRHNGNFGVLFHNDTLKIERFAPIFDMNLSLFPYVEDVEFSCIGDKLLDYAPKLGNDFTGIGQIGMNDIIRDRIKDMRDFTFSFRGDDIFTEERIKCLERTVQKQADAILGKEKLRTMDVFPSPKWQAEQELIQSHRECKTVLYRFMDYFSIHGDKDTYASVCDDPQTTQACIEKKTETGWYIVTVDFHDRTIKAEKDMVAVPTGQVSYSDDEEKLFLSIKELMDYLTRKQGDDSSGGGNGNEPHKQEEGKEEPKKDPASSPAPAEFGNENSQREETEGKGTAESQNGTSNMDIVDSLEHLPPKGQSEMSCSCLRFASEEQDDYGLDER